MNTSDDPKSATPPLLTLAVYYMTARQWESQGPETNKLGARPLTPRLVDIGLTAGNEAYLRTAGDRLAKAVSRGVPHWLPDPGACPIDNVDLFYGLDGTTQINTRRSIRTLPGRLGLMHGIAAMFDADGAEDHRPYDFFGTLVPDDERVVYMGHDIQHMVELEEFGRVSRVGMLGRLGFFRGSKRLAFLREERAAAGVVELWQNGWETYDLACLSAPIVDIEARSSTPEAMFVALADGTSVLLDLSEVEQKLIRVVEQGINLNGARVRGRVDGRGAIEAPTASHETSWVRSIVQPDALRQIVGRRAAEHYFPAAT